VKYECMKKIDRSKKTNILLNVRGETYNDHFIAHFPRSVPMKERRQSMNIWRRYDQEFAA